LGLGNYVFIQNKLLSKTISPASSRADNHN